MRGAEVVSRFSQYEEFLRCCFCECRDARLGCLFLCVEAAARDFAPWQVVFEEVEGRFQTRCDESKLEYSSQKEGSGGHVKLDLSLGVIRSSLGLLL